jgi:hypothetical protein
VDSFTLSGLDDMGRALPRGRHWGCRIIVQEVPHGEVAVWRGNGAKGVTVSRDTGKSRPEGRPVARRMHLPSHCAFVTHVPVSYPRNLWIKPCIILVLHQKSPRNPRFLHGLPKNRALLMIRNGCHSSDTNLDQTARSIQKHGRGGGRSG